MADLVNTVGGFLQTGILYATVLKYQMSAPAIIGIQVLTNLLLFSVQTLLIQNGITQTNVMYEVLLGLVLAVLYFWILLSRFNVLETIGIWIVITIAMIILLGVAALLRMGMRKPMQRQRGATLEVPVEPRYVVPQMRASGDFNRYQLKTHELV